MTEARKRGAWLADDRGVAGLIIAAVIAVVAFTALSIYLSKFAGNREFAKATHSTSGEGRLIPAVFAYYYGQTSNRVLPCPDLAATPTGQAGTCNASGTTSGVLPWRTLGLTQADALDAYGDYYTYIVSSTAKTLCTAIGNDYSAAASAEVTGSPVDATDLVLSTPTGNRDVAFAIIGHGANRAGAKPKGGTTVTAASANADEAANIHGGTPGMIFADAYNAGPGIANAKTFDDQVFAPSANDLENVCKTLTPGGQLNAQIAENFEGGGTGLPADFANSANTTKVTTPTGNNVAGFTAPNSYLGTATSYVLSPAVRPLYISAKWTANADGLATTAGMSIATRATVNDLTAGTDDFNSNAKEGLTFRFYDNVAANVSAGGVANHLSIRDNGAALITSTGTYNLKTDKVYDIEAYDDGATLWMRITQDDDITNTATVSTSTTAANDVTGDQSVVFINDITTASLSYLDEIIIGLPMLALETSAAGQITFAPAGSNGFALGAPESLTLEAWVRPRALTSGNGVIVSKWDAGSGTAATQAYRLYINSSGALNFDVSGSVGGTVKTRSYALNISPAVKTWTHVAVVFDAANQLISSYQNGVLATTLTTDIDKTQGVHDNNAQPFSVGAEFNGGATGAIVDLFNGDISDIRAWEAVRTAANVASCFESRLPSAACPSTNLIVNWKLDPGVNGLNAVVATASPAGTNGALSGFTDATKTGNTHNGTATIDTISANVITAGWQVGMAIAGANIPAGATIIAIDPGGLSITISANATADAVGVALTVTSSDSMYVPTLALFFRPFSTEFCPAGTKVGPYQCDFRQASQTQSGFGTGVTIPARLPTVYAKVWGAGGGGYDDSTNSNSAGGGGYSEGLVQSINNVAVAGMELDVIVGGFGTGSMTTSEGAGGGGASAIRRSFNSTVGLIAGGGGGASFSAGVLSLGIGGAGGGGGGVSAGVSLFTVRAPDSLGNCGGRGGHDNGAEVGPPQLGCLGGGADAGFVGGVLTNPTSYGGSGANASAGGLSDAGAGGAGYTGVLALTYIGSGGGGGGATGGEAGGFSNVPNLGLPILGGFGGGGGSGSADVGVVNTLGALGIAPTAGGSTDTVYYSPSYVPVALQNPGKGGITGKVNGHDGTVILLW